MDTADASVAASATVPAPTLECRLCAVEFSTAEEKRQHAKSEWHVYKIRCRVASADPETSIPPPDRPKSPQVDGESEDEETETESDTSSDGDATPVEFVPEECLFCNETSNDFDENISHMRQGHSFIVPFQSSLAVDLQTLIWFLHLVIFSYRECICCGKRRRTVEAVQHHMTSTGHCRFNITEETSRFYDVQSLSPHLTEAPLHPDDHTLRLPSGKLLAHRSYVDPASRRKRSGEKPPAEPSALPASEQGDVGDGPQGLAKRDRKVQALTTQLAQLRAGDQMSLVHLPQSQQRSVLVAYRKELDQAKRAERQRQRRVDDVGNKTAVHTKYYKQEVPVYMGG